MGLQTLWKLAGILLLACVLHCFADEADTECESEDATDVNRRCPLTHNLASSDYKCSLTSEVLCGKTTLVGEDSVCALVDDARVAFSCQHGKWTINDADHLPAREKRSPWLVIGGIAAVACFFFCGRGDNVKQNNPPSFTSCPADITQYAPSGQIEAVVTWEEPSASDPDGEIPSILGPATAPGSSFPEGSTQITYRARDGMGFTDYCSFTVRVIVRRCAPPRYVLHATQTCDFNVYGSVCTHTCDPGYHLPGSAKTYAVTCQQNGLWSPDFPKCEPVSCGSPQNVSGGQVACPRQPVYPEYCSVICDGGFQHTGSYFVGCEEDASWTLAQPCRDREAPTIDCPPNQQLISGPLLSPVNVTWPNPVATDNSVGKVTITGNPANGSLLAPGFHVIKITAADESGNTASCNFLVTIQGRQCPTLSAPSYGRVTCTRGYVEGSECTVSCYPGYQVQGDATVRCLQSERWNTSLPACEAVTCRALPQVSHGRFVCPAGQQYPSVCSLLCDSGFATRDATFIQCLPGATWTTTGSCRDMEAPQFPNGCPDNIEIIQPKLGSQARVKWNPPVVTDNSGGEVYLTSDIPSNSSFPVGVTWVTYTATDISNNSRSCRFSVTVTTLSCAAPNFDSSGHGLMLYACPNGQVYGATCTLSCAYGYPLVGANTITCERDNSTHPPIMKWEWPGTSAVAPVCRENNCTYLPPPQNGALTCNLGNFGWDCLMSCQTNWDVPAQTNGHFYCTNSNKYWTPPAVPDCIVKIRPGAVRLNLDLFYYTNTCSASFDELKAKFVQRMNSSDILRDACVNTCHLENLKVYCGPVTSRRRREAQEGRYNPFVSKTQPGIHDRFRRQTSQLYIRFDFDIAVAYDNNSISSEQTYQSVLNISSDVYKRLQSAANTGQLNFGGLVADEYAVGYPKFALDCPNGTFFKSRDNTVSLSCAGCGPGHYLPYDPATGAKASDCKPCPVGSYTDMDNATSCTPCPLGWSTANKGSKNSTYCKELCPAGSVSYNAFTPCQPCPPGRYQSHDGSMTCDLCPAGTWTQLTGASQINQCIPSDVRLVNSSLTAEVTSPWSAMTVTSWLLLHVNTVASVTLTLGTGSGESVTLVLYNGSGSAAETPLNGTTSVTLGVTSGTWSRVLFTVDKQTPRAYLYFDTSMVLSFTHSSLAASVKAVLRIEVTRGKVQASGLRASNKLMSPGDITSQPVACAGNNSDNILTWTPAASSLVFPTECDAVDKCQRGPCGTHPCENQPGGFVCQCQAGWTGVTCTTPPDPCQNHQCHHGATCISGKNTYTCICTRGYTGRLCDTIMVDGGWGDWTTWTGCTATCGGGGQKHRNRRCNNPAPLNGGLNCTGSESQTISCGEPRCPVHGNWSVWGQWSACSASCEGGERTRHRMCDNPVPLNNGSNCEGIDTEEETCNTDICPVDGAWSEWSAWTQCSASCRGGTMSRSRTCTSPPPANGGRACSGNPSETEICKNSTCPECPQLVRHLGSLFFCRTTTEPFLNFCNLTCASGFLSATPLPLEYSCGEPTNYLWSHQGNASDTIELPDICRVPTSAQLAAFESKVPMNAGCDDATSAAMKTATEKSLADKVECRQQNEHPCQTEVSIACDSGSAGWRKRSAGSLVLLVKITSVYGTELLHHNDTASIQQYAEFLRLMEASAATVVGNATHNIFTSTIGDQIITPDLTTLTFNATLVCSRGSVAVKGVCVECPQGYKEENGQCVPCPRGQYQNHAGSTSCKPCPAGLTWDIIAAFSVHQCLYPFTALTLTTHKTTGDANTNTATPSQPTGTHGAAGEEHGGDHVNVVAIVVGIVCASVVVLGLASILALYKCRKTKIRADAKRNQPEIFVVEMTSEPLRQDAGLPGSPPSYDESVRSISTINNISHIRNNMALEATLLTAAKPNENEQAKHK